MKIQPVILAGGNGSRLWPISREVYPKQLLELTGRLSLLQATLKRVSRLRNTSPPVVVVGEEHRLATRAQIAELGLLESCTILLEPLGRSTAPAICGTTEYLRRRLGEEAVLLILPSDHLIGDEAALAGAVERAAELAGRGRIVTFGVPIERPETGYGYIEAGADGAVLSFREKPRLAEIRQFIASGGWYWNSGMFTFTARVFREEMEKYAAAMQACMAAAIDRGVEEDGIFRFDAVSMADVEDISIDYVLMEKTDCAAVVAVDLQWKDVGSWQSLWEIMERDRDGNVCRGDVLALSTRNSMIMAEERLVATLGLEDTVVVETADAVLVAAMTEVQNVRRVVSSLKASGRREGKVPATVRHPWGSCTVLAAQSGYRISRLLLNPDVGLPLQEHAHRHEHWLVVAGTARVSVGGQVTDLRENQTACAGPGVPHRIENPGPAPLEIIEVQLGGHLDEDDVVGCDDQSGP